MLSVFRESLQARLITSACAGSLQEEDGQQIICSLHTVGVVASRFEQPCHYSYGMHSGLVTLYQSWACGLLLAFWC